MRGHRKSNRRGAVLVLFLLCLISLFAFLALAIDLGMVAVARTQCQDAADAAAMAGARTLNGITANNSNNNYSNVEPTAEIAATSNSVLAKPITASQLTLQIGRYAYVLANQQFEGQFPGPSSENWSLVQATVASNVGSQLAFAKVFNFGTLNIQATATAVHRPRDIAIILDYSGSMRFASLLGDPYYGDRSSNNPDSTFPVFGHYSATGSAALQATSFNLPYDEANISATTTDGRAPICADFYTDASGTPAFSSANSTYATTPGGQNYLKTNKNSTSTYCKTVAELLNLGSVTSSTRDATFETSGYTAWSMAAANHSYTQGPGYWGKTFFVWPPDPAHDWRKLYFFYPGTATPMDDNARLWDSSGNWQEPSSSTYAINYTAILAWIKSSPNPFPSRLQSGRILYYDAIPDSINTSTFPPTNLNERFWKDYIDNALGVLQTSSSNWTVLCDGNTGLTGYGSDYTWGTVQITAKSSLSGSPAPYMHYSDNPKRPKLHFWFGPMTMVDFLGNYNLWYQVSPNCSRFCWWPGTCHEAPMYACKLGMRSALSDIQSNHPNDFVSLIYFSDPKTSTGDYGSRFNRVRVGLGRDYASMQEALWYPPSTVGNSSATVRPYDADNEEVPRAMGSTCYAYPLMLTYNQFSSNTSLRTYNPGKPSGDAGGNGRKGAQKIVIFETDGSPNTTASAGYTNGGTNQSYYNIRYNSTTPGSSEFPTNVNGGSGSTVTSQIYSLCSQLAALETASPPGYSTTSKKVLIHCIGFGPEFDPSSGNASTNTAVLNQMQTTGNVTDGMPGYKIVYGNQASIVADLQQAIRLILQSGVQVSLIQ